jgi:putative transposase
MPKTARNAPGGMVFHVLNRGVGNQQLFFNDDEYLAFEWLIQGRLEKHAMQILGDCLMRD